MFGKKYIIIIIINNLSISKVVCSETNVAFWIRDCSDAKEQSKISSLVFSANGCGLVHGSRKSQSLEKLLLANGVKQKVP